MNIVADQLLACLNREGKIVTDVNGDEHLVLFRKNDTRNSTPEYVTIYHDADSGIAIGDYLAFENETLLVISRRTMENSVYRHSDCVRCNLQISVGVMQEVLNDLTGDYDTSFVPQQEYLPCFMTVNTENETSTSLGTFDNTIYTLYTSATCAITTSHLVQMTDYIYNKSSKTTSIGDSLFDVQSVDISNVVFGSDIASTKGLLKIVLVAQ